MNEENVSLPVAQALASALAKIEAYVPTEYVDNSEPDIDAEHLNHAEQGIMRATNLLNAAVDVIQGQESRLSDAETKVGTAALTGGMTDLSSGINSLYSDLGKVKTITTSDLSNKTSQDVLTNMQAPSMVFASFNDVRKCTDWLPIYGTAILIKTEATRCTVVLIGRGSTVVYVKSEDISRINTAKYALLSSTAVDSPTA